MIDLNQAGPQQRSMVDWIDQDELSEILADTADQWVPVLFPRGRFDADRHIRCANIRGDPPRKQGSCVIYCHGERAGSWHDYDGQGDGGGPLSTIKEATGRTGAELFAYARELVGDKVRRNRPKPQRRDDSVEINHICRRVSLQPIADTPAAIYFRSRGITEIPQGDLRFHPDVTHWRDRRGMPAIVAPFMFPDGEWTGGIHRIYLRDDYSWHEGKKMLGPVEHGVIRLGDIEDFTVGVGEGIESSAAAMQIFKIKGGWAAASSGGMNKLAEWLQNHAEWTKAHIRRMAIFIDRGKAGVKSGRVLRDAVAALGVEAVCVDPKGSDDFADDLKQGITGHVMPFRLIGSAALAKHAPEAVSAKLNAVVFRDEQSMRDALRMVAESEPSETAISQALAFLKTQKGFANLESLRHDYKAIAADTLRANRIAMAEAGDLADWRDLAAKSLDQSFRPTMSNVALVIRYEPEWRDAMGQPIIAMNEFTGFITLRAVAPWERKIKQRWNKIMAADGKAERPWTDDDDLQATNWVQGPGRDIAAAKQITFEAVQMISGENVYHPVRDWLDTLKGTWDRTDRLRNLLPGYAGCDDTHINHVFGAKWCISAVARIYEPGCKADCALILEGTQGIGKSTFFRVLASDDFFTDQISDFGSKDAALEMQGVWVIELAELDAMGKAETSRIKRFIGQTHDRFRPPYGRSIKTAPRQMVFCGTTNENEYLRDATGGRRFWPAESTRIDLNRLAADRVQIWAEAVDRYHAGEKWWLEHEEDVRLATEQQDLRFQSDVWEPVIERWVRTSLTRDKITIPEVLLHALGIEDKARWDRGTHQRVAASLRRLGYILGGRESNGARERYYVPKPDRQRSQEFAAAVPVPPAGSYIEHRPTIAQQPPAVSFDLNPPREPGQEG